jgi:purine-binding chemotaxis protein CheW
MAMVRKNQFVRFMVGKESYGVDVAMVQEIVTVPDITRVPDTPAFFEGIMNLRGKIVSVIDFRKKLQVEARTGKKSRILVTEMDGKVVGLIVDEVSEVLRVDPERIEPPPDIVNYAGARYITGVGRLDDKIILLLDLKKIMSPEEMAMLAAVEIPSNDGYRHHPAG